MGTRARWGSASGPSTPRMYCGLEDNKALERAMRNPAPERLAHLARPDLDAASAAVVQRRYLEAVGDQRSARALVMQARAQQREAHARQRAELRGLEQALQTPFALARAREAARLGAQAHGAALARPQFADVAELERTIASAMTSARGQARMGAASTHVKERERAVRALMQLDQSALMHAPADAHAPTNALARARDNVARAQSAQAGRRPPLLRRAELHALIARLLDEKVRADGVDDLARRGRQSLSEIVHDDLSRTHALRELAAAQEATLRQSCVALHHASERVRLFAAAMGWLGAAAWPAARVGVWLSFLKRVFPPSQGRLRERLNDPGEVMVPWRDFEAAIRETFDSELLAASLIAGLEPSTQVLPEEPLRAELWQPAAASREGSCVAAASRASLDNSPAHGLRGSMDGLQRASDVATHSLGSSALSLVGSGAVLHSSRQISLDVGLGYLLDRVDATWDAPASHLHRPRASETAQDQLFLTHSGGY